MLRLPHIVLGGTQVLAAVFAVAGCTENRMTVGDIERRIGSAIPHGTHQSRVLAILDSLKLEHSEFSPTSRTIAATVPDSSKKGIVTRSFHIIFSFDSAGALSSHTTRELFTGP